MYETLILLIRPYGHVAWRGHAPPNHPVPWAAPVCGGQATP